ncbi:MAG: type III pantothenate kinase [Alistipes sp.]|nr:type III pantothenate kinase [Alistipes sp.]
MANLIIDKGNTFTKIAVIEENEVIYEWKGEEFTATMADELCSRFRPSKAIISSTRADARQCESLLRGRVAKVLCLDGTTPLPIGVDYNRATLGSDRIAAAVGAVKKYGAEHQMLIIDAGTALTFDFVSNGVLRGGNISAGVDMRFEALQRGTASLPLCSPKVLEGEAPQLGHSTEEAIRNGVMESVFYEVKGYISDFERKNENILIIFIGGDAEYFVNRIKNAIFAGRNMMYSGLNEILEYNATLEQI